jgi:hypothetical protein
MAEWHGRKSLGKDVAKRRRPHDEFTRLQYRLSASRLCDADDVEMNGVNHDARRIKEAANPDLYVGK